MAEPESVNIDDLIEIVRSGGSVRTGISFYNDRGDLLLDKDALVTRVSTLMHIKRQGHVQIPIEGVIEGGIWDKNGDRLKIGKHAEAEEETILGIQEMLGTPESKPLTTLQKKVQEIREVKRELEDLQNRAKTSILEAVNQITENDGEFETQKIVEVVNHTVEFLRAHEETTLYLAREIFSHDYYLYNHSVNVCTLGAAVLHRFNSHFSQIVNTSLHQVLGRDFAETPATEFRMYQKEELQEIALGFFLHDIGMVLLPKEILMKTEALTPEEMTLVRTHSYHYGPKILAKNNINSVLIRNIVSHHHAAVYPGESNSYPENISPQEVPLYVKVCKLVDQYDAMTSKRPHRAAINPITAVTNIVRWNADKNRCLQLLLASFVKVIGVYPPGSVIYLQNGQLAYVLDSAGPTVIPFTDIYQKPLSPASDPIDLDTPEYRYSDMQVDRRKPPLDPMSYYHLLPVALR